MPEQRSPRELSNKSILFSRDETMLLCSLLTEELFKGGESKYLRLFSVLVIFIQESMCLINECYGDVEKTFEQCLLPCKGLYADISVENSGKVEEMKKFDHLIKSYENYKRGYTKDITYPPALRGRVKLNFIIILISKHLQTLKRSKNSTSSRSVLPHPALIK